MKLQRLEPRTFLTGLAYVPVIEDLPADEPGPPPAAEFGFVNGVRVKSAAATGGDGTGFVFTLAGPGTGRAFAEQDGFRIVLDGTTSASSLNVITSSFGQLTGLTVNGSLRKLTGKEITVNGDIIVTGTLAAATLFAVGTEDEQTVHFDIQGAGKPSNLTLALVADTTLTSASPIKSLTVGIWADLNAERDLISAPTIGKLQAVGGEGISGSFGADVIVSSSATTITIGSIKIAGRLNGAVVRSAGAIGAVTAGGMVDSALFAGMRPEFSGFPTTPGDFTRQSAIRSVTLTGAGDGGFSFANSTIAAFAIGRVQFGTVDGDSGTAPFGVAARFIIAYSRNGHALSRNLGFAGDFDQENNYFVRIIA